MDSFIFNSVLGVGNQRPLLSDVLGYLIQPFRPHKGTPRAPRLVWPALTLVNAILIGFVLIPLSRDHTLPSFVRKFLSLHIVNLGVVPVFPQNLLHLRHYIFAHVVSSQIELHNALVVLQRGKNGLGPQTANFVPL